MKKIYLLVFSILLSLILTSCNGNLFHSHTYEVGLCECGKFDKEWLKENYDLDDKSEKNKIDTQANFSLDSVLIVFKKSNTYPTLTIKHFDIKNTYKFSYLSKGPYYKPNCREIGIIYINGDSKRDVIKVIKELEKLPFVYAAEPNYIITLG